MCNCGKTTITKQPASNSTNSTNTKTIKIRTR